MKTSGLMLKKGGGRSRVGESLVQSQFHRRNWQRRWFVLNVEAYELVYYKDASLSRYKGCVRLTNKSSIQIPDTVQLRGRHRPTKHESLNYFEIHGALDDQGRPRRRPLALRAQTNDELLDWLGSLQRCLGRLRRETRPRMSSRLSAHESSSDESTDDDVDDVEVPENLAELDVDDVPAELPAERAGSWQIDELREALEEEKVRASLLEDQHDDTLEEVEEKAREMLLDDTLEEVEEQARETLLQDESLHDEEKVGRRKPPPPPAKPPPPATVLSPRHLVAAVDEEFKRKATNSPRAEALETLARATEADDADAIAVSVDYALEVGVSFDHPTVVAARDKLANLELPPEVRQARIFDLESTLLAAQDDAAKLGAAISDAVAFGVPHDAPAIVQAQDRLCALIVARQSEDAQGERPSQEGLGTGDNDKITRVFAC